MIRIVMVVMVQAIQMIRISSRIPRMPQMGNLALQMVMIKQRANRAIQGNLATVMAKDQTLRPDLKIGTLDLLWILN